MQMFENLYDYSENDYLRKMNKFKSFIKVAGNGSTDEIFISLIFTLIL